MRIETVSVITAIIAVMIALYLLRANRLQRAFYREHIRRVTERAYGQAINQVKRADREYMPVIYGKDDCLDARRACCDYDSNGELVHLVKKLKYDPVGKLQAKVIAAQIAQYLELQFAESGWTPTLIVPVPTTDERMQKRSYNQSVLIAHALSARIQVPCRDILSKRSDALSQVTVKSQRAREANIADSIMIQYPVSAQRVLLIDDMATTGATMKECAKVLKQAGAITVWGLSACATRRSTVK